MLELPTLKKKTATGATQTWTIFAEDGKYWTVSGQKGGKMVTYQPTVCKPKNVGKKNETTAEQQAETEAKAKWQKKVDEGYANSLDVSNLLRWLRIEPMLAKKYEDYSSEIEFPVYSQPKLDGLRCIVMDGSIMSRKWKPFATLDHLRDPFSALIRRHPEIVAFDGEMYSHALKDNFEELVSIVKQPKATAEDIAKAKEQLQYHIYDYVDSAGNLSFEERTERLKGYLAELDSPYIEFVRTDRCDSREKLDRLYDVYMQAGYEGQMVRTAGSRYQQKRTKDLLKRKEFIDEEFEIVGSKQGKGSREGCITLRVVTKNGKEFDSVPKGGVEYLQRLWARREELVGLTATIKFQNYSSDGIPRFNNTIKIRDKNLEEVLI